MQRGFSLVELSIVLVILGLLTGGILAGQSLIRASELRGVVSDLMRYRSAGLTFRDRYMAIPGDMPNATSFWGTATNCPGTSAQGSVTVTCNGDGDGAVEPWLVAPYGNETFRLWQQLANAGLIEGSYSGVQGASNNIHAVPGSNSPQPRIRNMVWNTYYLGNFAGDSSTFRADLGNFLGIADAVALGFKPEEAWGIDSKLDDGKPATGFVIGGTRGSCTNSSSATDYSCDYLFTSTSAGCSLIFAKTFGP